MSAPTSQPNAPGTACGVTPAAECADVNASLRLPVLTLFVGAAFWFVVAATFALIASLKFHAPNFLADSPLFTYGRVHAAHLDALAYGFAAQAGLGVTLWILAQTGKSPLALPGGSFIAAILWNLGVLVGVGSVLTGGSTGFEFLEFSQAGSVILFVAYLILALAGVFTFAHRTERNGGMAQWFLLAALFWFPWIFSTATFLLGCAPVRGVTQALVGWWFANNFVFVWFGLIGTGALFYFVPKYAGRPLHSRQLALFAFFVLTVFGSWAGIPASAPLPAWIPALSSVGAFMAVVAVLAVAVNCKETAGKCLCTRTEPIPKFIGSSGWAFGLFVIAKAVASFACVSAVTDFTWLTPALTELMLYGFVAMLLFGAIYHIAPQLTGTEYFCRRPLMIHFWLSLVGVILLVGALAVAGIKQGRALNDANVPFMDVVKGTLFFFRISTLGDVFILLGGLTLLVNLGGLLRACCKCCGTKSGCCDAQPEVAK
jgi:cytochrome c oxidase cbb3-type subunit 1